MNVALFGNERCYVADPAVEKGPEVEWLTWTLERPCGLALAGPMDADELKVRGDVEASSSE